MDNANTAAQNSNLDLAAYGTIGLLGPDATPEENRAEVRATLARFLRDGVPASDLPTPTDAEIDAALAAA
jgi:hypothetical protein